MAAQLPSSEGLIFEIIHLPKNGSVSYARALKPSPGTFTASAKEVYDYCARCIGW
jgi:hypothetical protein